MLNAHKKPCERCDHVGTSENDLNAHKQAEHGILMSSVGFMLTNSDPVPHDAEILDKDAQNAERSVRRRKTKSEYLKEERQVITCVFASSLRTLKIFIYLYLPGLLIFLFNGVTIDRSR